MYENRRCIFSDMLWVGMGVLGLEHIGPHATGTLVDDGNDE